MGSGLERNSPLGTTYSVIKASVCVYMCVFVHARVQGIDICVSVCARVRECAEHNIFVLSQITESSITREMSFGHHCSVIKSVRWRETDNEMSVFASAGNDKDIYICDARQSKGGPICCIEGASKSSINFLDWSVTDGNMLLSAGGDPEIRIWDIRSPKKPAHSLVGHHSLTNLRQAIKSMHRALFVAGGGYVLSGGEKSQRVSLYNTMTGATVSRGEIGCMPTCLATEDATGTIAVAGGRSVRIFSLI